MNKSSSEKSEENSSVPIPNLLPKKHDAESGTESDAETSDDDGLSEIEKLSNLEGFKKILNISSVSDRWAYGRFVEWCGPYLKVQATTVLSYRCVRQLDSVTTRSTMAVMLENMETRKKYMAKEREEMTKDGKSDTEKKDLINNESSRGESNKDPEENICSVSEDYLANMSGDLLSEKLACKGHFKVSTRMNEVYCSEASEDELCYKCVKLQPKEDATPQEVLKTIVRTLNLNPFINEVNNQGLYKLAWVNQNWAMRILELCQSLLVISLYHDTMSVAVEVFDEDNVPFTYVPFGFLISSSMTEENVFEFLKGLKEKCNLSKVEYISSTSNSFHLISNCCRKVFGDSIVTFPNLYDLESSLRNSYTFEEEAKFTELCSSLKEVIVLIAEDGNRYSKKTISKSLGVEGFEDHPRKMEIVEIAKLFVDRIDDASLTREQIRKSRIKEEVVDHTEFIAKQNLATRIQYLDFMSEIRGNNVAFSLPAAMIYEEVKEIGVSPVKVIPFKETHERTEGKA